MRLLPASASALLVAVATGCGGSAASGDVDRVRVVLDAAPNGAHVGLYTAVARDFDGAERVRMRLRPPGPGSDPARLLLDGRAELAVLDLNALALARERGADVVAVAALVQRPLAAVLAEPGVRRPRALEGRRVRVGGLAAAGAVLDAVVRGDGGRPARVRRTRRGPAEAATGSWHVDGVALRRRRPGARAFRVDGFGAPAYPGLVLCAARTTLQDDPTSVRDALRAIRRGYDEALLDPELAVETLTRRARGADRAAVLAQLQALSSAFTGSARRFGDLDRERLDAWAAWAARVGIVERRPDIGRAVVFDAAG